MQIVREATPADYDVYTRLFGQLGVDDPVPARDVWVADLAPNILILEEGGAVVGYALARVFGAMGYVVNVVVDAPFRGRRLGQVLMRSVAGRLRAQGSTRWCLNVKIENAPAIRLYESCGLTPAFRSTAFSLDWKRLSFLPSDTTLVSARVVEPVEDASIEEAFRLPSGRLADRRKRSGIIVLRLFDPSHPANLGVGIACFDPCFPRAFPFAVARPELARALLLAMKTYARPEDTSVGLVIERDAPLAALLHSVGARTRMELLHMVGQLPRLIA
jgi:GNAT superfamily N-acetyltransferase